MPVANVLVLGGSGVGKTHYAGQLLGRLRNDRKGKLSLVPGGVDDYSKLEEVLSCLENGRAAGHTSTETWTGTKCKMQTEKGEEILLEWPEYAGERLLSIIERRLISDNWRQSINAAKGWLLLLRPSMLKQPEDLLVRPVGESIPTGSQDPTDIQNSLWADQARYVELLQMLLFASGRSTFSKASAPRLAIVLSCWDELDTNRIPEEELSMRMPLLNAFVGSNWQPQSWSVWGLSSLGKALSQDNSDDEFVMQGPEKFGYVVLPGTPDRNNDLTEPVNWLLKV